MSDEFIPTTLTLPTAEPYAPVPGALLRNIGDPVLASTFDGRSIVIPIDPLEPTLGLDIFVEAPTLIRLDGIVDSASPTGLLQNVGAAVRIVLRAATRGRLNTGAVTARFMNFLRGSGPFIWLPSAGFWTITCRSGGNVPGSGTAAGGSGLATAYVGMNPNLAASMMAGQMPFQYCTGEINLPAATLVTIPNATLLTTFIDFNWFGMTKLRLFNRGGANSLTFRVGGVAVVGGAGYPTAAGTVNAPLNLMEWADLAGQNVTAISTLGTDLYFEAHSI